MDGYATSSNALTIGGLKQSIAGQAPEAIFCDINTLAAAPRSLIAAGLGDTLAKFTSVNDLRLGHLLWDERWDEAIGQRMEDLAHAALARADEIARADSDAVALLTRSLIDSGLEMAAFGSSAPGGGSEHHISHCWEMRALLAGEPPRLHGAKVGVAAVMAAGWYAAVREMTRLGRVFEPDQRNRDLYEQLYTRVYKRMYRRLRPLYDEIRDITGYPPRD
jgi:glycerol-1-phosphate dehydrogenase [NAD(P)+]